MRYTNTDVTITKYDNDINILMCIYVSLVHFHNVGNDVCVVYVQIYTTCQIFTRFKRLFGKSRSYIPPSNQAGPPFTNMV